MGENESGVGVDTSTTPAAVETPALDSAASTNEDFVLTDNILGEDLDESPPEGGEKPLVQATETKPAASETKSPVPVTEPAKPVAKAEPSTGVQAPQGEQRAPDLSSMAPDALVGELARNREALIDNIAQTRFTLTQQERDALETDAVGAIPKLLARVYFEAATTALNQIASHVPRMVANVTATMRTTNEAEDAFYSKYPGINRSDAAHARAVQMAANVFRANNPTATREQAIDVVGKMAMAMLGLQTPVTQTNGQTNGVRRPPAFTPAGGSARAVSSTQVAKPPANPFDGLGQYFDDNA